MKLALFASAAVAAALVAAPAMAHTTVAQVDLSVSMQDWDYGNGGSTYDNTDVALGGAFATAFDNGITMQVDGQGNLYSWDGSSGDDNLGYVAAHFANRNDQFAVGAFLGFDNYYGDGGIMVGVEGQAYMTDLTFNASVGYVNFDDYTDYSMWDARLGARYFINDSFAIDAYLGWASWDAYYDYDGWNGSLGAEYQFQNSPVSAFAQWRYDSIDYTYNDYTVNTFLIGVRLSLGSDNLRTRTNSGASFTGAQAISDDMLRW